MTTIAKEELHSRRPCMSFRRTKTKYTKFAITASVSNSIGCSRVAIQSLGSKLDFWLIRTHLLVQPPFALVGGSSFRREKLCWIVVVAVKAAGASLVRRLARLYSRQFHQIKSPPHQKLHTRASAPAADQYHP